MPTIPQTNEEIPEFPKEDLYSYTADKILIRLHKRLHDWYFRALKMPDTDEVIMFQSTGFHQHGADNKPFAIVNVTTTVIESIR